MNRVEQVVDEVKRQGGKGLDSSIGRHLKNIVVKFKRDHCLVHAGSLAYVTILALVPLIIVSFSLFSTIGSFAQTKETIMNYLMQFLVPQSAHSVIGYINTFAEKSKTLGISGMVALIFLGYSLFTSTEDAFNEIWAIPKSRSAIIRLFVFTNIVFWMPILMGLSIYMSTKAVLIPYMSTVLKLALIVLPFVLAFLGFTMSYIVIPSGKVNPKNAAIGGMVAAVLWEIGKNSFDIFVAHTFSFKAFSKLYGSLVILPIFLIWIYLCWVITLIGASIASYSQRPVESDQDGIRNGFLTASAILILVAERFMKGEPPVEQGEIMARWPLSHGITERLAAKGFLTETEGEGYTLGRPPEAISMTEVLQLFCDPQQLGVIHQRLQASVEGLTLREMVESGEKELE